MRLARLAYADSVRRKPGRRTAERPAAPGAASTSASPPPISCRCPSASRHMSTRTSGDLPASRAARTTARGWALDGDFGDTWWPVGSSSQYDVASSIPMIIGRARRARTSRARRAGAPCSVTRMAPSGMSSVTDRLVRPGRVAPGLRPWALGCRRGAQPPVKGESAGLDIMCTAPCAGARSRWSRRSAAPPGRPRGRRTGGFRARGRRQASVRWLPCSRPAPSLGPVVADGSEVVIRNAAAPRGVNIMCDSARTEQQWPAASGGCRSSASASSSTHTPLWVASSQGNPT